MQLLHWLPRVLLRHKSIDFLCKVGLQERISEITFNHGSRTIVDLSDPEPRNVFIKGEFEPHFFEIANALMPQDGIFFDLGANVGFCSFGLVSSRPKANFHMFEASPRMIDLLDQSIGLHGQHFFQLNGACISNKEGKTAFCLNSNQSGQSHVATSDENGIEVPSLILDKYCKDHEIERVDFAKIDLEGHEIPALQGWKKCLSKHSVKAIYLEIMPENQTRYGRQTKAPLCYLESLGYELYLCKEEDFGLFGNVPAKVSLQQGSLQLARFKTEEYPEDFATDILVLSPT